MIEDSEIIKPVISCSTLIVDDLELFTHTLLAFISREAVMELLLLNHPMDCPICDQGGECDLQDQFMVFGNIVSRSHEKKKNTDDKELNNTIKLNLNKCIHCTRCVRFLNEISGDYSFSLLGRGEFFEISNYDFYLNSFFLFSIVGNIIDLCPVGGLTEKKYSFDGSKC
jgi:NADH dehydrogenase/NADH:ubiquinone oxidoreductase subunit G